MSKANSQQRNQLAGTEAARQASHVARKRGQKESRVRGNHHDDQQCREGESIYQVKRPTDTAAHQADKSQHLAY
jgi:hypothetical protein